VKKIPIITLVLIGAFVFCGLSYAINEAIATKEGGSQSGNFGIPSKSELEGKQCATRTVGSYVSDTSVDCSQVGLNCLPAAARQFGTGCEVVYQCLNTAKITSAQISACDKGWEEYQATIQKEETSQKAQTECTKKGTGIETGVFTKGLSPACLGCGECTQKDVFQEFVNIFTFILQIAGSLAVLIVIVSGLLYITAGGDMEKTKRAKAALTAAIVGVIIVLTAFILINFVLGMLGYTNASSWFSPSLQ